MKQNYMSILFASWHFIWFVLLVCIIVIVVGCVRYTKKKRAARKISKISLPKSMLKNFSGAKEFAKYCLWVAGTLFLGIAFLQPQWNKKEEVVQQQGRDVLIALDISRSMLAQDYQPSRLAFAQKKIMKLISLLSGERVGLILFSGDAFVQCPLTHDKQAFSLFLQSVDAETISAGSTALDRALGKAIDVFSDFKERKNKIVVLFTDGEDFSSNLAAIKQQAIELGLHIFTVGVGTEQGAPIPIIDSEGKLQGHEQDATGAVVMSRMNQGILRSLADDVGGTYVQATYDDVDIKTIAHNVELFEKELLDDKKIEQYEEQYPWFAGCAACCFLLEWLL